MRAFVVLSGILGREKTPHGAEPMGRRSERHKREEAATPCEIAARRYISSNRYHTTLNGSVTIDQSR